MANSLLKGMAIILLLQWISSAIISALGIAFPPALLGMLLLVLLLFTKIVPEKAMHDICDLLISQMGMFFLPAGVSIILYTDVIKAELPAITVTIIVCSLAVLISTAFFLERLLKNKSGKDETNVS
ncbi:MAG: CidA/LrgA family protein [Acidaminococcaceae bacterium]|nr:CidA/LrgA family protein [Acidaminococcaceae bacterium]